MAEFHILDQNAAWTLTQEGRDVATVVFHFPVPDINNEASVNYRTALTQYLIKQSELGVIESECPWITGMELTAMQSGEVYEHIEAVKFRSGMTKQEKLQRIQDTWNDLQSDIQSKLSEELKFWGYDGTIV